MDALHIAFALTLGLLSLMTLAAWVAQRKDPARWSDALIRIRTWWFIAVPTLGALALGWPGVTLLFAFVSFLALREFLSLVPFRREDRPLIAVLYLAIPLSYGAIWIDGYGFFLVIIPVYAFLVTAALLVLGQRVEGFLATAGRVQWGLMLTVFALGHVALIARIPDEEAGPAGAIGLLLLLILVTQLNDSFQYIWGKMLGATKVIPNISPNKTRAGLIGGSLSSATLFMALSPFLSSFTLGQALILALTLPFVGFFGDAVLSALKRDLGVKDTSNLLPGHGGILDRVDSLMFTAPWLFHFTAYWHVGGY